MSSLPAVLVLADGRFAQVGEPARRLLGRPGRMIRTWRDTRLPVAEIDRVLSLVRAVRRDGGERLHRSDITVDGDGSGLELRMLPAAERGQVVVTVSPHDHAQAMRQLQADNVAWAVEVRHRVRNALHVMSALIHMEAGEGQVYGERLDKVRGRIIAMALAHDTMDVREGVARVDLAACLRAVHAQSGAPLAMRLVGDEDCEPVSIDVAVPLVLIAHEALVSAARGGVAEMRMALSRRDLGRLSLEMSPVLAACSDFDQRLVTAMVRQAAAEMVIQPDQWLRLTFSP